MPSIPVYGFDELEPSLLNKAKRRVIGLMDINEETLTQEPETDPTNGNQNTEVEVLTDDIYNVVKDIEVLDSYINDATGVDEFRLIDTADKNSLRAFRAELKKSASQIAKVNNALRKINTTYDKLRPNMVYTSLKTYTGFVNSVSILKKSALSFFDIIDELIFNIRQAQGVTTYKRPTINNRDDGDIEEEEEDTSTIPPILSTQAPFPPLPPAPPPPPLPPPPPPPKPPSKAKILAFKVKVSAKATTAGLDAFQTADVLSLADDFVANNGRVGDATEIDTLIADYLASSSAPPAPAPSPAPPLPPAPAPAPSPAPPAPAPAPSPAPPAPAPAPAPPTFTLPPSATTIMMGIPKDPAPQKLIDDLIIDTDGILATKTGDIVFMEGMKKLEGKKRKLQNKGTYQDLFNLQKLVNWAMEPLIVDLTPNYPSDGTLRDLYKVYRDEKKKLNLKTEYKESLIKYMKKLK